MSSSPDPFLLPHQAQMRWIHSATLSPDNQTTTAILTLPADHPFLRNGFLLPTALIEFLAQTAAAGVAISAQASHQKVRRGLLAAIPECTFLPAANFLTPGTLLECSVTRERSFGPFIQARLQAQVSGNPIIHARMTFHITVE